MERFFEQVEADLTWASQRLWQAGAVDRGQGPVAACGLWLVLEGRVTVQYAGTAEGFAVDAGQAYLLPQGVRRDRVETPQKSRWLSVGLSARLWGRFDLLPLLQPPLLWEPSPKERRVLEALMETGAAQFGEIPNPANPALPLPRPPSTPLSRLLARSVAASLFGLLWQKHCPSHAALVPLSRQIPPWLAQTLHTIERDPSRHLPEPTRQAGVSASQFRRVFHGWVGVAPQVYLSRARMTEARRLLTATDLTVAVVAQQVGFESLSHFTRLFTQSVGMTPARYRRDTRQMLL